jgi:hypothetical protein
MIEPPVRVEVTIANPFLAALVECVRLPVSPLIELGPLFQSLSMPKAPSRKEATPDVLDNLEAVWSELDRKQEDLIGRLRARVGLERGVRELRDLAGQYRGLELAFQQAQDADPAALQEALELIRAAIQNLESWADGLERGQKGGSSTGSSRQATEEDAKLAVALDRLGFGPEQLKQLDAKAIQNAFRHRSKSLHPDRYQDPDDKDFHEQRMKELTVAKDLLLEFVGSRR